MALSDISLTAGMRSNLISLQSTATLLDRTQQRLSTGKKVNTALDNPTNFFTAQNHTQRASALTDRKDAMGEAIQAVKAANDGITAISALLSAAKGLGQSARSADNSGRNTLSSQFNAVLTQITQLASDSNYQGKNFLNADSLQVLFNENGSSSMSIAGFSATAAGLGVTQITVGTNDVTTASLSGGTGATTVATAIHTAILDTAANPLNFTSGQTSNLGTVTGSYIATQLTAGTLTVVDLAAGNVNGFTGLLNVSGLNAQNGYATTNNTFTGTHIDAVYINGQVLNSTSYVITGMGAAGSQLGISFITGISGLGVNSTQAAFSVTYDITIKSHLQGSSGAPLVNLSTFNLSGVDTASGLTSAGLNGMTATGQTVVGGGAGVSGIAVYNSGVLVNSTQYTIVGNQIQFGAGVPSTIAGSIQYNYNTGFSTAAGIISTANSTFVGMHLNTGATNTQAITAVYVDGVVIDPSEYRLSGAGNSGNNTIVFLTGNEPATTSQITYTVVTDGNVGSWTSDAGIDASNALLDAATTTLQTQAASMASNLSVINVRQDFTTALSNDLLKGADNLTLADMNEEGANMLMLQTRQQLGTTSLKMASDTAAAIMRLF